MMATKFPFAGIARYATVPDGALQQRQAAQRVPETEHREDESDVTSNSVSTPSRALLRQLNCIVGRAPLWGRPSVSDEDESESSESSELSLPSVGSSSESDGAAASWTASESPHGFPDSGCRA